MFGLDKLNIKVSWNFRIVPTLYKVEPMSGVLVCDFGGKLTSGVIDPHGRGYLSATAAIAAEPHLVLNHLLGPVNQAYQSGQTVNLKEIEFEFYLRRNHWDALCCFVLSDFLIKTGTLPSWTNKLVESANLADHGKVVLSEDQSTAPIMLFHALVAEHKENVENIFSEGLKLLRTIGEFSVNSTFNGPNPFLSSLPIDSLFKPFLRLGKLNEEDFAIFSVEIESADQFHVSLPYKDEENSNLLEQKVKCLMFKVPPKSRLFVHWARSTQSIDLLVVPSIRNNRNKISHWFISVDPESKFNLYRLGYRLELEEKKARKKANYEERGGEPRWGDSQYSDNEDPWYDGRDHNFTLVDSPHSGTVLSDPKLIRSILESRFYGVNLNAFVSNSASKPRFFSYMFFEIDSYESSSTKFPQEVRPFEKLRDAFSYVKQISFFQPNLDKLTHPDKTLSDYSLNLYASSVTKHAVLEIESVRDPGNIKLEDVPQFLKKFRTDALEIGKWVESEFDLNSKVWGRMGFSLLLFMDPDLNFHDEDKIRRILGELINCPVSLEEVQSMKNQPKGNDVISSSTSVCVLRQSSSKARDEDRRLIALYALFVKTAYRRFSQRLEPLTKNEDLGDALDQILNIQRDFSRFLASNDFSSTEISLDGDITNFFEAMSTSLALEEQKQETNLEMQLIGNLASSFENREQARRSAKLSIFVVLLSLFAVCDFIYAFSSDFLSEPTESLPRLAMTLGSVSFLGIIASIVLLRRKKH
jgi:hypothetical protein